MLLTEHPFFPVFFHLFIGLPAWGIFLVAYAYQLRTPVADGDELLYISKTYFPRLLAVYFDALVRDKHIGTVFVEQINRPAYRDEAGHGYEEP